MKQNFLLLTIDNMQQFNRPALTEVFGRASGVKEYFPGCWIIQTDEPVHTWEQRIYDVLGGKTEFLIVEGEVTSAQSRLPTGVRTFLEQRSAA